MEIDKSLLDETKKFEGEFPAEGLLGMGGFLFYELGCVFVYDDPKLPTLRLHADGFGDDFDVDSSVLAGSFSKPPAQLVGECRFTLTTIDFEEGIIRLKIMKDGVNVGEFEGESEGLGEAELIDRKGTLSIASAKEKDNKIIFDGKGQTGIETITFAYGSLYSITPGQPWGGVETTNSNNGKTLTIDIYAARKNSSTPANWFNGTVNNDGSKMFHSRSSKNVVSKMHFAIKGVLTINRESFNVCLGQGEDGLYNNWHIASEDVRNVSSNGNGADLGRYHIWAHDSYTFKVKLK